MESHFEIRERLEAKLDLASANLRDFKPSYAEVADAFMSGDFTNDTGRSIGVRLDVIDEAAVIIDATTKELEDLRAKEDKAREEQENKIRLQQAEQSVHDQLIFSAQRDAGVPLEPVTEPFSREGIMRSILGDTTPLIDPSSSDIEPISVRLQNLPKPVPPKFNRIDLTGKLGSGNNNGHLTPDGPFELSGRIDYTELSRDSRTRKFEDIAPLPLDNDYSTKKGMTIAEARARALYPGLYAEIDLERIKGLNLGNSSGRPRIDDGIKVDDGIRITEPGERSIFPNYNPIKLGDWEFTVGEGFRYVGPDVSERLSFTKPPEFINDPKQERKNQDRRDGDLDAPHS